MDRKVYQVCGYGRNKGWGDGGTPHWMNCGTYKTIEQAEAEAKRVIEGSAYYGYSFTRTHIRLVDEYADWVVPNVPD